MAPAAHPLGSLNGVKGRSLSSLALSLAGSKPVVPYRRRVLHCRAFPHDSTRAAFPARVPHGWCWCRSQTRVGFCPVGLLAGASPLSADEEGTL